MTYMTSSFYLISALILAGILSHRNAVALPSFSAYEYHQSTVKCDVPQRFMVKQLPYLKDNSRVILEGNIQTQLDPEHYLFADYSGVVEIKISSELWGTTIITPYDTVRIEGAMEKDRHTIMIMADNIDMVKNPA